MSPLHQIQHHVHRRGTAGAGNPVPVYFEELLGNDDLRELFAQRRDQLEFDVGDRKLVDAQRIFFQREPRTLEAALKFYCQEELVNAHDAAADVDATMRRLDAQADAVDHEMVRVDGLLESAERVSARADTLSKMTYGAVAKPVIKTAAVVKGTSRAARRLTGRDIDEQAG